MPGYIVGVGNASDAADNQNSPIRLTMFVKIRVGFDKTLHQFPTRREAFAWVEENFSPPQVVALLSYEYGQLENMDRYFFQYGRFIRENIEE